MLLGTRSDHHMIEIFFKLNQFKSEKKNNRRFKEIITVNLQYEMCIDIIKKSQISRRLQGPQRPILSIS